MFEITPISLILSMVSLVILTICVYAMWAVKDVQMSESMMFLRAREITKLLKVLLWGMSVPLVAALSLTFFGLCFDTTSLSALENTLYLVAFGFGSYVLFCGSMKVRG
jgi:hypothetical protein